LTLGIKATAGLTAPLQSGMDIGMRMMVLGSGQDAGIPHTGCYCEICERARKQRKFQRLGPSVALFDKDAGISYLVDASPDIKPQLDMLHKEIESVSRPGKVPVSGILLTHAHFGHCSGLWQLGRETLNEVGVPVFCTPEMKRFLSTSYPFRTLAEARNIVLTEIEAGVGVRLGGMTCIPVQVPHRSETADAVGYVIKAERKVAYIPDTDVWTDDLLNEVAGCDLALVDGTFYSEREVPHYVQVPHPPVEETVGLLKDARAEIYFTHINHTNPLNRNGKERRRLYRDGFQIAYDGLILDI